MAQCFRNMRCLWKIPQPHLGLMNQFVGVGLNNLWRGGGGLFVCLFVLF